MTPALQLLTPDLLPALKNESRSVVGGSSLALRRGLVAGQIALSLLLLIGAGLFGRSLYNLLSSSSGMRTASLLTFSLDPSLSGYSPQHTRQAFVDLQAKLAAIPGVQSVSGAANPLLANAEWIETVRVEGYQTKEGENVNPDVDSVLPDFFSTMGIPLLAGREFTDRDVFGAPPVIIVSQSFVDYFFKGRNPIGARIGFGNWQTAPLKMQVVGVVRDTKGNDLKAKWKRQVWIPALQGDRPNSLTYYLRAAGDPLAMASAARGAIRQFDPALPVYDVKTLQTQINETHYIDRLISMLSAAFGILATLLAAVGLYGLMAFSVARRTPEIGIRIALGAQSGNVIGLVMREVLALTAVGIAVALPIAFGLGRFVQSQLFGMKANDPAIMTAASLMLAAIALFAGYLPARRATRIDPIKALGWE